MLTELENDDGYDGNRRCDDAMVTELLGLKLGHAPIGLFGERGRHGGGGEFLMLLSCLGERNGDGRAAVVA